MQCQTGEGINLPCRQKCFWIAVTFIINFFSQFILSWSAMAERFSALDCIGLLSLSKTPYHNCFSPPRSKWVPVRALRVGCCVWLALYAPKWQQLLSCILPRELKWFQEWFMRLMSRGNNVKRYKNAFIIKIIQNQNTNLKQTWQWHRPETIQLK